MDVFFSIIMPVYNVEQYIEKSVTSILSQSYKNFELIMVDDGSTDGSPKLSDYYASIDARIKVIHQKNGGQTVARKNAVKRAKGKYIVCVDSDDWIDKDYLLSFKNILDKTDVDIICCGMMRVVGKIYIPNPLEYRKGLFTKKQIINEIYPSLIHPASGEGFPVCVCGKAIRSNIYKTYQERVAASLRMGEDLTCSLPCVYHAKSMYIMEECIYYYRDNPESYTRKKNVLDWNGPVLMMENLKRSINFDKYDFEEQLNRRILREIFLVAVSQFNRNDAYGIVKKDILMHISTKLYYDVIKSAHFIFKWDKAGVRYYFYSFALKTRQIWLIKLYNKYLYR